MKEMREEAIDVIVANLDNYTREQAGIELDNEIENLQQLVCMHDYRNSDLRNAVEGLCGFLSTPIMQYMSMMIREENIPESIKDEYSPDEDDEEFEDENEFNPYDFVGLLGEDLCQEYMEMVA